MAITTASRQPSQTSARALASACAFIEEREEFAGVRAELTATNRPHLRFHSSDDPSEVREVAPSAWLELADMPRTFILRTLTGQAVARSKYA